jgi:hypothetical protein
MSFGNWFSRGHDDSHQQQQEEENTLPDAEQLSEALFDLDLDEGGSGRRQTALDKAGPSAAAGHRRRWSFGRQQVAPQPVADLPAGDDGSPVSVAADDLLATASEISFGSAAPAAEEQGCAPPPRGQGYRRLWHTITSVRKGDPLPGGGGASSSDVTVESLVKAVQVRRGTCVVCAVGWDTARACARAGTARLAAAPVLELPCLLPACRTVGLQYYCAPMVPK